jgi:hypothetical protein
MRKIGYKLTDEQKKRISVALSGKKKTKEHNLKVGLANKGKKRTPEMNRRSSEVHKGHIHSEATKLKMSLSHKGRTVSEITRQKLRKAKLGKKFPALSGEKSGQWKGGITALTTLIRHTFEYRQWVSDIFHRDDFTCQKCFTKGGYLHAHHIKYFSVIFKENNIKSMQDALECCEFWNINNGVTLCKGCHKKQHA